MWYCLFRSVLPACVKCNRWKLCNWINNAWKQGTSAYLQHYTLKPLAVVACVPALIKVEMTKSFPWVLLWSQNHTSNHFAFLFQCFSRRSKLGRSVLHWGVGVRFCGSQCWNDSLPFIYIFQLSTHFLSPLLTVGEHSEGARLGSEVSKIKGRPTECVRVFGQCSVITELYLCSYVVSLLLGYCSGSMGCWEMGQSRKSLFDQLWKVCTVARSFTFRDLLLEDVAVYVWQMLIIRIKVNMIAVNILEMTMVSKIKIFLFPLWNYSTYTAVLPSSLSPSVVCFVYVLKTCVDFKVEISSVTGKTLVTSFFFNIFWRNKTPQHDSGSGIFNLAPGYPLFCRV